MRPAKNFAIVLVTAPDLKTARALARSALRAKLVACANLLPKIESHYWWNEKIESGTETLLILKTTRVKLAALEKLILARHPYETPEFLVLPLSAGTKKYLDWMTKAIASRNAGNISPSPSGRGTGVRENAPPPDGRSLPRRRKN